jgi:energy-coupling factor transporter transmembrane protein EcfT
MASGLRFRAAAGALGVLFARSYARAGDIHRAMLARGFHGRFLRLHAEHFRPADTAFALLASLAPVAVRLMVERVVR